MSANNHQDALGRDPSSATSGSVRWLAALRRHPVIVVLCALAAVLVWLSETSTAATSISRQLGRIFSESASVEVEHTVTLDMDGRSVVVQAEVINLGKDPVYVRDVRLGMLFPRQRRQRQIPMFVLLQCDREYDVAVEPGGSRYCSRHMSWAEALRFLYALDVSHPFVDSVPVRRIWLEASSNTGLLYRSDSLSLCRMFSSHVGSMSLADPAIFRQLVSVSGSADMASLTLCGS